MSKIKILAIPSDQYGVGKFRVMGPYTHLQETYPNDFHIDIKYNVEDNDSEFDGYDVVVLHSFIHNKVPFEKNLVRADHLPLMLSVMGAAGLVRGDKVKVQLGSIDAMALDITGTVIEKIVSSDNPLDTENASGDESMEDLEEAATGPIAIALNVNETPSEDAPA